MDLSVLLLLVALVSFALLALKVLPQAPWLAIGLFFFVAGHMWSSLDITVR